MTALARPVAGAPRLSVSYPGVPESVTAGRHWLLSQLGGRDHPAAAEAELAACELMTNAIKHSDSRLPGGEFTLQLDISDKWIFIGVTDKGGTTEPTIPQPDELATCSRGLAMMAACCMEWGWRNCDGGRVVWAIVRR